MSPRYWRKWHRRAQLLPVAAFAVTVLAAACGEDPARPGALPPAGDQQASQLAPAAPAAGADLVRQQLQDGWELPFRGPFRLPDGRLALPRAVRGEPAGAGAGDKRPSALPYIWGLDGRAAGPTGGVHVIVAKVTFNDVTAPEIDRADLLDWFFNTNAGSYPDSLAEYYDQESYGQLQVSGDVYPASGSYVLPGSFFDFMMPFNQAAYTSMWNSLLTQLDAEIDGTQYDGNSDGAIDAIIVVPPDGDHFGVGGPMAYANSHEVDGLVSYQMDGKDVTLFSVQSNVFGDALHSHAVPAHEFGHLLGLPDLYDGGMGAPSNGPDGDDGQGDGGWALMSQGGHLGPDLPLCAPHKLLLGWDAPLELSTDLGTEEAVTLRFADEEQDQLRQVVLGAGSQLIGGTPVDYAEYILLEARAHTPAGMPETGLLVWHVCEDVYLDKVLGGAQPEPPNKIEEYKFIDLIETPYQADALVDRPYEQGDPASLVRASDLWPYDAFDSIDAEVPAGVEYPYKHPSLLPRLAAAPWFDDAGPPLEVTDIARIEDGISFNYRVPLPEPPSVVSFTPVLNAAGTGPLRRLRLSATVAVSGGCDSIRIELNYLDAAGLPQVAQYDATDGSLSGIDVTPLLPNQRVTLSAVAGAGAVESEPVIVELDAVTLIGDVNCDDMIDELDALALAALLGSGPGDGSYRPWHNADGFPEVDERDVSYLGYHYGETRPLT